jgi:hypothetical protein
VYMPSGVERSGAWWQLKRLSFGFATKLAALLIPIGFVIDSRMDGRMGRTDAQHAVGHRQRDWLIDCLTGISCRVELHLC